MPDELTVKVEIPEPILWWPNGYGEQPLYQVEVFLLSSDLPRKCGWTSKNSK